MGSYRRHHQSKAARKAHTKRVKARKKKYGGLASFAYDSAIGINPGRTFAGKLK